MVQTNQSTVTVRELFSLPLNYCYLLTGVIATYYQEPRQILWQEL